MTAEGENTDVPVSIPSAWELAWVALETRRDGNVPGPVWKVLRHDPSVPSTTYLIHLPPGWHDPVLIWHPVVEEGFKLAGAAQLADDVVPKDCYLYRPPGILHGPVSIPSDEGATIIQRAVGEMRYFRYDGDEFPHRHGQPVTDQYLDWPVEWNEHLDTNDLEWEPISSGGWAGASIKWIYRHRDTGGGAVLLSLPAGWRGAGSTARGPVEEFVVTGAIEAGGVAYSKWGYAYRPAGMPAGEYASPDGALLFCWWNGANELEDGGDAR